MVFVSGMVGWDAQGVSGRRIRGPGPAGAREHRRGPRRGGRAARAHRPHDLVRRDKREYIAHPRIGVAYREIIGRHFPAMTAVEVAALIEDAARVEIEVTAVVPD